MQEPNSISPSQTSSLLLGADPTIHHAYQVSIAPTLSKSKGNQTYAEFIAAATHSNAASPIAPSVITSFSPSHKRLIRRHERLWAALLILTLILWTSTITAAVFLFKALAWETLVTDQPWYLIWLMLSLGALLATLAGIGLLCVKRRDRKAAEKRWAKLEEEKYKLSIREKENQARRTASVVARTRGTLRTLDNEINSFKRVRRKSERSLVRGRKLERAGSARNERAESKRLETSLADFDPNGSAAVGSATITPVTNALGAGVSSTPKAESFPSPVSSLGHRKSSHGLLFNADIDYFEPLPPPYNHTTDRVLNPRPPLQDSAVVNVDTQIVSHRYNGETVESLEEDLALPDRVALREALGNHATLLPISEHPPKFSMPSPEYRTTSLDRYVVAENYRQRLERSRSKHRPPQHSRSATLPFDDQSDIPQPAPVPATAPINEPMVWTGQYPRSATLPVGVQNKCIDPPISPVTAPINETVIWVNQTETNLTQGPSFSLAIAPLPEPKAGAHRSISWPKLHLPPPSSAGAIDLNFNVNDNKTTQATSHSPAPQAPIPHCRARLLNIDTTRANSDTAFAVFEGPTLILRQGHRGSGSVQSDENFSLSQLLPSDTETLNDVTRTLQIRKAVRFVRSWMIGTEKKKGGEQEQEMERRYRKSAQRHGRGKSKQQEELELISLASASSLAAGKGNTEAQPLKEIRRRDTEKQARDIELGREISRATASVARTSLGPMSNKPSQTSPVDLDKPLPSIPPLSPTLPPLPIPPPAPLPSAGLTRPVRLTLSPRPTASAGVVPSTSTVPSTGTKPPPASADSSLIAKWSVT